MENKQTRLVIITWVSASGKTTLQDELLSRGWKRPINFTTRKPRSDDEMDEYLFLTEEQYFFKLRKWDFLEHTNYGWNWYGVWKALPEWEDVCVVLDPVGKTQVLEKIARENIDVKVDCFFLECSKELQKTRLEKRGDSAEEVEKRERDFKWMYPQNSDILVDGGWSWKLLADLVEGTK